MAKQTKNFYDVLWILLEKKGAIEKFKSLGWLVELNGQYEWTQSALEAAGKARSEVYIDWIEEYLNKFAAIYIGIAGKKSSISNTLPKMKRFMQEYKYDKETILSATDSYINSWLNQGTPQYIREAHYFIFKRTEKGVDTSDLATWCDHVKTLPKVTKVIDRNGGDI